jgi:hypothetical protein
MLTDQPPVQEDIKECKPVCQNHLHLHRTFCERKYSQFNGRYGHHIHISILGTRIYILQEII